MIAEAEARREPHKALLRRVLVAEDSPITQDLLKLLLNQRGHEVDIVSDGLQALAALREKQYDVALLDFHLPGMDGLDVAAKLRAGPGHLRTPRLIAMTADTEGLLSHASDCESFDHILPKPLDIYEVGRLVEEQAEIGDHEGLNPRNHRSRLTPVPRSEPSGLKDLGHECLYWPGDVEPSRLSSRAMQATLGDPRFDALIINAAATQAELAGIWRHKALHLLPVIDMTGVLGRAADLDGAELSIGGADKLKEIIERFNAQRASLHRDLVLTDNVGEKLVGRAFVSGKPFVAYYEPRIASLVSYDTIAQPDLVVREGDLLTADGLFKKIFFDRLHVCGRCNSNRLNVREECSHCRSADLAEESYLHHFRCAYQGPDSKFRQGDDLICPKCRRALTNFGSDYDRPGSMSVCRKCGHADSEPVIGFMCLDCGAHSDSATTNTRDVYSYGLTEQGQSFAKHGAAYLGPARRALRFTDLPLEVVIALNAAAKQYSEDGRPFTLANIFYDNEREITAEHGARQFANARDQYIDSLRAGLGPTVAVTRGTSYDVALLRDVAPDEAMRRFDAISEQAQSALRFDLGATCQALGPDSFS
ncbi:MAG: response regulator [Hyphomicrobium sp.]|jgi:CheY-like chemotaxis protein